MSKNFSDEVMARRARLERMIAVREEAITQRLKSLKEELDARLDIGAIVQRNALPIAGIALGVGVMLGRIMAPRRSARHESVPMLPPQMATPSKPAHSPTFFTQLVRTVLNTAKSLALNYAADFATRKLQDWLSAAMTQNAQSNSESQNRTKS
ncbi:MAG: hypothetical protein CMR00_12990 [[Chlorobium] sp. 445]|nr:MAG: hypothetical protein CMR00_12990 [[Chlorobium] sp. 445]